MEADNWVTAALKDWGLRHSGQPGDEIGYKRKASFAHLIRDRFTTDSDGPGMPPTDLSCEVDMAVAFLSTRGKQGRIENAVLRGFYVLKLPRREIARRLVLNEHQVRESKKIAERTVEMYLHMRCRWDYQEEKTLSSG